MRRTVIGMAVLAAGIVPGQAIGQMAQPPCGDRDAIVERLEAKWGEAFAGGGLQSSSSLFEVWMSPENGTWTILKTNANGTACVMASGTNWLESLPGQAISGIKG